MDGADDKRPIGATFVHTASPKDALLGLCLVFFVLVPLSDAGQHVIRLAKEASIAGGCWDWLPFAQAVADTDNQSGIGLDNHEQSKFAWERSLLEALRHPLMAFLLLLIGFSALLGELQAPGVGLPGFTALICFVLFFWSQFLGGTLDWLELLIFMTGVVCVLFDVFVIPGVGVFAIGGVLLVLASLVLAQNSFVIPQKDDQWGQLAGAVITALGSLLLALVMVVAAADWLAKIPILNRLFVPPPHDAERRNRSTSEKFADYSHLVGQRGITMTTLKPAGKVRFGDQVVDVVAEGFFVPQNSEVVVVEVTGHRVVVRPVDDKLGHDKQDHL